ncbi:UDP-glycosyltransferase [Flavobacterium sp. KACC 22761]|uniref:UDP-glycosyltransferase n=1 Tax=Flavobacterium sp. KACC 22761 TaxID=3092665 RepID=UPI002A765E8F|nr:UDP-glycosyltransferase [Flavobacterium sp. KACC 22761]WPO79489.1 UDP-glycosyltransferase [Flavobacterium sp. KACC 22761]
MSSKKIMVFFPDGGGLRNFAYSSFKEIGDESGFEIIYWNASNFQIQENLGFKELKIQSGKVRPLTPLFLRAKKHIELNLWKKEFNDSVYDKYKFPFSFKGVKKSLTSLFILLLIQLYASRKGLTRLIKKINNQERKNSRYESYQKQLLENKPEIVFCSNQRNSQAISAILAARDLGIKTVCFIQSWDNVPKAMNVYEADYYMVWSDLMKNELLKYYPTIAENQVFVTGTPQFEPHFDESLSLSREAFFKEHSLDLTKRYVCYSGDDFTTSPLDQYYLEDLINAVRSLNLEGENLGVIYRRCPFDSSDRYNLVLEQNKDVVAVIDPLWEKIDGVGDLMPLPEDAQLLYNICEHSEMVVNICSTTIFDFVMHNKPCIYLNYEQPQLKKGIRDIGQNYDYVHFRSMPSKEAAVFCTSKEQLKEQVKKVISNEISNVAECKKWLSTVAGKEPELASKKMWEVFNQMLS